MRYHYMDSARAIFMIIGIYYHTALIYSTNIVWRVSGEYTNVIFDYLTSAIHFRMHGFFIIAGFFAALIIKKKGLKYFLNDRIVKLGVPLLFIGFTLNYYMNKYSSNRDFSENFLIYIWEGEWLGHLWFLGNLILYVIITALFLKYIGEVKFNIKFIRLLKRNVIFLLFIFTFFSLFSSSVGLLVYKITNVNNLLFFSLGRLFEYLPYYTFGFILFNSKKTLDKVLNFRLLTFIFIISIPIFLIYSYLKINYSSLLFTKIFVFGIGAYLATIFSLFIITFFKKNSFLNKDNSFMKKLSESSYSIYLLHQPIIVFLFHIFEPISMPFIGFIIISILTSVLTYYLHFYLINKIKFLNFLFNGKYK